MQYEQVRAVAELPDEAPPPVEVEVREGPLSVSCPGD